HGEKRVHQSVRRSRADISPAGSAGAVTSAGTSAMASASVIPALRPILVATMLTAYKRAALACVRVSANGPVTGLRCLNFSLSVGHRGSETERYRRIIELQEPTHARGFSAAA